ncbi:hypothetical protein PVAND_010970 [Polypedilum vanderplanki]|uniref:Sodium/calcium exchanger membrane region domain-containing protein n=1 Tax=Polypedilum vanderplanki TaxID=319348 RepID=A0A9J6CJ09_POLVA|nr:hypothetical protein PVAND_010970 [Polypedilum vanderplanki]
MINRSRPKRNRYVQIILFIIICTFYYAYSAPGISEILENEELPTILPSESVEEATELPSTIESSTAATFTGLNHHGKPTLRPRRPNCTAPAIEQFPPPLMSAGFRKHGGIVIHILVAIFTFLGLAIVCDDYFVSSLDRICEELKLSPDVAGATFMAAGSSAPELATVIIGVFFAKDDIGVSGVIGSAVFNIMFVISVCALCSGTVLQLNWWPLVRDCTFYSFSILVMLFVICNEVISWPEALFMLICYIFYCIALHFNTTLEKLAQPYILKLPIKLPTREEQSALVTFKNAPDSSYTQGIPNDVTSPQQELSEPKEKNDYNYDANASWDPNSAWSDDAPSKPTPAVAASSWNATETGSYNDSWGDGAENYGYSKSEAETPPAKEPVTKKVSTTIVQQTNDQYYKPREQRPELPDPLIKPEGSDLLTLVMWYIVFPIHYMCRLTMPDVKLEKYKNWYPLTFLISMIWISFYSYFMVWMITIIGFTLGIPDTVMGLTFVAAGVSVPDALSSIAVIKEGYGDMAVSNAVGSNVFDILVCLGLPWFIQTAIISPGSHVNVISKGLAYSTLSLLSTVLFLLTAIHMNSWKLDKKLGFVLMFWYLFFITIASLYELNVFGFMNPPECTSDY